MAEQGWVWIVKRQTLERATKDKKLFMSHDCTHHEGRQGIKSLIQGHFMHQHAYNLLLQDKLIQTYTR